MKSFSRSTLSKSISSTQLQREIGQVVHHCSVNKEHFIIKNRGYPIMAIIPMEEYRRHWQIPDAE